MLNAVVAVLYGLCILPGKAAAVVFGRDSLRLRRPAGATSYWLPKAPAGGLESYFSTGHGRPERGAASATWFVLPAFYGVARLVAPRRRDLIESRTSAAEREQGIPDEIYTLW